MNTSPRKTGSLLPSLVLIGSVIAIALTPQIATAGWRDTLKKADPTNRNSAVRQGLRQADPINPNSTVRTTLRQADPTNRNSAVRQGLRQIDPITPDSVVRKTLRSADPSTKIDSLVNDRANNANRQISETGSNIQGQLMKGAVIVGGLAGFLCLLSVLRGLMKRIFA